MKKLEFKVTPLQYEFLEDVEYASSSIFHKKWVDPVNPYWNNFITHLDSYRGYDAQIISTIPHLHEGNEISGSNVLEIINGDRCYKIPFSSRDVIGKQQALTCQGITIRLRLKQESWVLRIMRKFI